MYQRNCRRRTLKIPRKQFQIDRLAHELKTVKSGAMGKRSQWNSRQGLTSSAMMGRRKMAKCASCAHFFNARLIRTRKHMEKIKAEKAQVEEKLIRVEQVSRNKRHEVSDAEAAALVEADLARALRKRYSCKEGNKFAERKRHVAY